MLYERMIKARKNLGLEKKILDSNFEDTYYENENKITGRKEEVLIGHNYTEDNSETDDTLGEGGILTKDPESPNNLDPDSDVEDEELISDEKIEEEVKDSLTDLNDYAESITPPCVEFDVSTEDMGTYRVSLEDKEEGMDILCSDPYKKEDTSGNTKSNVDTFLEKYADGDDVIQILRKDLMSVLSDMQWIKESKNQHEQFAMDFADALNEISVAI